MKENTESKWKSIYRVNYHLLALNDICVSVRDVALSLFL